VSIHTRMYRESNHLHHHTRELRKLGKGGSTRGKGKRPKKKKTKERGEHWIVNWKSYQIAEKVQFHQSEGQLKKRGGNTRGNRLKGIPFK